MVGQPDDTGPHRWELAGDGTLARFAAEARVAEAVRARSRERWLRQEATAATTVAGICWSLAEAGQPLTITTVAGRSHQGVVRSLGQDFVSLGERADREVLVPLGMVATVAPGRATCPTGRPARAGLRLADALVDLAGERPLVVAWCLGATGPVSGELVGASGELLLVTSSAGPGQVRGRRVTYVRLASLCELSLTASG